MTYYKVKLEYDNKRRSDGSILVANELYTQREIDKFHIYPHMCDKVEISRKKTYQFFGARFANK